MGIEAAAIIGGSAIVGGLLSNDAQRKATNTALDATTNASNQSLALQERMYNEGIERNQPFYEAGTGDALNQYQSAILGKPVNGVSYDYLESPVAKNAAERGGVEYMRGLGARGLAGGGIAPYGLGQLKSSIFANDYERQIGRLSDLVNIGRGGATSNNSLGQNYATGASNTLTNMGENEANANLALGRGQASLYSGIGNMPMNLASAYMMGGGKFDGGGNNSQWGF
jgi:hypothetical protein